jgi:hypothetical protein
MTRPCGWQDIVTAPRDRDFLACLGNGYVTRARYIGGKYFASDSAGPCSKGSDTQPYYWQPLPKPPKDPK